ncbi:MAG: tryptophan--tRNA ligase [Candidatus Tectomicrobia bacterium]|uniref:Tryptophan--tRNA ligase n=1 Tax=Tectimicrobiota bacterium TaxID=2528274 RepID=A0A932HY68_UNCTE|nr:tryptophan--tRNA ligase [Candidatus Tectomicrobia bacterium]
MADQAKRARFLSGVQPSGRLHLGNYFGALRQHIALQDEGEAFYFIANYHAMTTVQDPGALSRATLDVALDYLALGLDPRKAVFFRQSDVPEVAELAWVLSCVTGKGLLDRATSYKDKVARGITPSMGLYAYPVLMAADILIYRSNVVPVGEDQVQHIEMTRDMATAFNTAYGEVFPLPAHRLDAGARVPGLDGQKMSKSYGNTIEIFEEGGALKKKVMSIVTDSTPLEAPKNPETCNVFALYRLVAPPAGAEEMARRYRAGGFGYGDAKKALLAAINDCFGPFREERKRLAREPAYAEGVLAEGGARARAEAQATMRRVREAVGLPPMPVEAAEASSPRKG